jgi:hypothetical protein
MTMRLQLLSAVDRARIKLEAELPGTTLMVQVHQDTHEVRVHRGVSREDCVRQDSSGRLHKQGSWHTVYAVFRGGSAAVQDGMRCMDCREWRTPG